MSITKIPTIVALSAVLLATGVAGASAAGGPDHRGSRAVCENAWVEHGPADHPTAPAYRGDHFRITRATYAHVHRTNGADGPYDQLWAQGVLTHRETKGHKTFAYRGWIRVAALGHGQHC
ncbi:MAG TPA: hypothetical protein VGM33_25340 [Baekduia sp.]|jgi:hypothetical protein